MPSKRGYTLRKAPTYPKRRLERRIKIPQPIKRPLRFQLRSIVKRYLLRPEPYYFILHRRGPHRGWEGVDQLEARAVPKEIVRGTLPERIVWKFLVANMRFIPGVDFEFQSSLQGGRIDLGGIVADFKFPILMIIIQVQGPTHEEYIRKAKDDEQTSALKEMGFDVFPIMDTEILDEYKLEEWMRRVFSLNHRGGSQDEIEPTDDPSELDLLYAGNLINEIGNLANVI